MRSCLATLVLVFGAAAVHADVAPWAGVYVARSNPKRTAALLPVADVVWWIDRDPALVRVAVRGRGYDVAPLGGTLVAPRAGSRAWRMHAGNEDWTQVVDPLLARLQARLAAGHRFVGIDERGHPTPGGITIHDGLVAAIDRGDKGCIPALLRPDPGENRDKVVALAPPQPAAGKLAVRAFMLLELDPGERPCSDGSPLARPPAVRGLVAGAYLFARPDGEPVAVELVGYMLVELYVDVGLTPAERRQVFEAASQEIGRQAE